MRVHSGQGPHTHRDADGAVLASCQTCGARAVWEMAPADSFGEYCDECVPRGCSCNVIDYDDPRPDAPQHTDEQGRRLPCCEFWHNPEGFPPGDPEGPAKHRAQFWLRQAANSTGEQVGTTEGREP